MSLAPSFPPFSIRRCLRSLLTTGSLFTLIYVVPSLLNGQINLLFIMLKDPVKLVLLVVPREI